MSGQNGTALQGQRTEDETAKTRQYNFRSSLSTLSHAEDKPVTAGPKILETLFPGPHIKL